MSLPVSFRFAATSPRVACDPFMRTHGVAYRAITGRNPSAFERSTASALWLAYVRVSESSPDARSSLAFREHSPKAFQAVSAATGGGKSIGAQALIAHLSPAPCALIIQTLEGCEKAFQALDKLLPGKVAVYTSLHKANASPSLIAEKRRELGLVATRRFTEDEFKVAQVVITTHERWKREIESGADLGVRHCNGNPRELVIVDEDPSLERVYVKQPEDVSRLASVFADAVLKDEARAVGFTSAHYAAETLSRIHQRMYDIKSQADGVRLYSTDIVTAADADMLDSIQYRDILDRLQHLPASERMERVDDVWSTVDFLRAAAQGRVFYSRDQGGAFYAYALQVPVQPRTLILDGTADINGMYALGSHISIAESEKPNYAPLQLAFVNPPAEFVGKMKPGKLLCNRWNAEPYMVWFFDFLRKNTTEGEHALIYAKDALLAFGIHRDAAYDESDGSKVYQTIYKGRHLHWCNFGRGRGSNDWKHCTVSFRLGDFHMKKATLLARIGSVTGKAFSGKELSSLSSGRTRDPMFALARDTHLIVATKQDAARICIRHLSDDGVCEAARLYLVDTDKALVTKYQQRMFPGSKDFRVIECDPSKEASTTRGVSSVDRLADLLLASDCNVLTADVIGIESKNIDRALSSPKVSPIVATKGWTKSTRRAVGLPGKGYVLMRAA